MALATFLVEPHPEPPLLVEDVATKVNTISPSGSFLTQRTSIVELAAKHQLPMMYPFRDYVDSGGLMSYAPDLGELAQRLAVDVHEILNGAKPGDIPIYRPSKFQLLVNLKTAKALNLEVRPTLLARADEVIE